MKHPSRKPLRGLLTLKALSPRARTDIQEGGRKPREFISLEGALSAPTQGLEQHDASDVETYQDAAGTRVVSAPDPWGTEEGVITQMGADGKSLKTTAFPLKVNTPRPKIPSKRGRRKVFTPEERSRRKRQKDTKAQQRYSGREYRVRFQAAYHNGKRKLEAKGKATPQNLRTLKEHIIDDETTPHTGSVKRKELDDFAQWVEDGFKQQTMRKNSR